MKTKYNRFAFGLDSASSPYPPETLSLCFTVSSSPSPFCYSGVEYSKRHLAAGTDGNMIENIHTGGNHFLITPAPGKESGHSNIVSAVRYHCPL